MDTTSIGRRISVVGSTNSGKTTFSRKLASKLGIEHVELDSLYHGPGWTQPQPEAFRELITEKLNQSAWVVDGNFSIVRDIVLDKADTVIWLDFSFPLIFGRLLKRTFTRMLTQEELWNGNRENLRTALFEKDSLILWAITKYKPLRQSYIHLFQDPEYANLQFLHFKKPRELEGWLEKI